MGSSRDSRPSSSMGWLRMSLISCGALVAGALVFARGADDDSVAADFRDNDVGAGLDWLSLAHGVDDLAIDFDGAAGEHFGAGDADSADECAAGVGGEGVVVG